MLTRSLQIATATAVSVGVAVACSVQEDYVWRTPGELAVLAPIVLAGTATNVETNDFFESSATIAITCAFKQTESGDVEIVNGGSIDVTGYGDSALCLATPGVGQPAILYMNVNGNEEYSAQNDDVSSSVQWMSLENVVDVVSSVGFTDEAMACGAALYPDEFDDAIAALCGQPCDEWCLEEADPYSTSCVGGTLGACDGCGSTNCGLYNEAYDVNQTYGEYFNSCTNGAFEFYCPMGYAAMPSQCGNGYCTIEDKETCEAAAAFLELDDTTAKTKNTLRRPPGCHTQSNGELAFNSNLESTKLHPTTNDRAVLCVNVCHF